MWTVVLSAPLGLIGMVPALLVFRLPLGFVAILGIIALGDTIMRNSVILIDQVQTEIAEGRDPWNAVLDTAIHRARPVMLTALATVLARCMVQGGSPDGRWYPAGELAIAQLARATGIKCCDRCMTFC
ncbi:efflux RND transporter permease subunit [Pseudomonas grandcourensis]|uniref:efflux RND transporter permease subunit n=1 Tax=Pseudomonas grandcourensis TaxID=3136736 RepID=UPI00326383DC